MQNKPPFTITPHILNLSKKIARELGALAGAKLSFIPIKLRKENTIKTIQSSLAIEGNTLTVEQISFLLEGKNVLGPKKDILEVTNALKAYTNLSQWDPLSINDIKKIHKILMQNLIPDNGKWRKKGVGIFKESKVAHIAPPAHRVSTLIESLFAFIKNDQETSWLLKACIFHYELEFIHPFSDGNGRMGRLWQQLLLMKEDPIFEFIPIESIIKEKQKDYYDALSESDEKGDSTFFIEFSLQQILTALQTYARSTPSSVNNADTRIAHAQGHFAKNWFSRKEYMIFHKNISSATASKDLLMGFAKNVLEKKGEKNQTRYRFSF